MSNPTTERGDRTRALIKEKIIEYIEEHGYAPTIKELRDLTGLKSLCTIHNQLHKMFENGDIENDIAPGVARAIRVPGYKFVKVDSGTTK